MSTSTHLSVEELQASLFGTATARAAQTPAVIAAMLDSGAGISDLVFSPGRPPQVERFGELAPVAVPGMAVLRAEDTARSEERRVGKECRL